MTKRTAEHSLFHQFRNSSIITLFFGYPELPVNRSPYRSANTRALGSRTFERNSSKGLDECLIAGGVTPAGTSDVFIHFRDPKLPASQATRLQVPLDALGGDEGVSRLRHDFNMAIRGGTSAQRSIYHQMCRLIPGLEQHDPFTT
jgi:hypothetical protein